jgi:UDP-N-acetylglucosamine 4,6-dehydratase/5-epimerase
LSKKDFENKIKKELYKKTILVTGGAGSIGSELVKELLQYPISSVRVLDINEHALFQLNRNTNDERFRPLLGNVSNLERLEMASKDVDIIIHMAAIKNLEISEFNPIETIDTNVNGMTNMIKSIIKNKPSKFINVSTDKAADPSTLYGSTKNLAEHLTSWGKIHIPNTKFASVRFGNVFETRGNVFEVWKEQIENKQSITVTDYKMKRYYFQKKEAVKFILKCISLIDKGNIFIPKMKMYNMKDLALKYSKNHKIIGLRQGEKLSEILLSEEEEKNSISMKDMWIIRKKVINLWPQKKKKQS